ncbi:amidase [Spelaeicoccus albus]|uniref:Aspartyl-tRNA(Asn)/glutamyl-tRNA(Gln) amidotransferase subunit A n=1 Tax=Spelaeicoccus albus TaxID=1280376 RepID=A0A7Z0AAS2_9MICO|nr:amidase [Spelaeicoccus albus]NYI66766.1 aspartyl-tRNA(Asn)/glutamyl-tRNA(Gln) amidotransferase subunit A [Spelaeicoccus albus]
MTAADLPALAAAVTSGSLTSRRLVDSCLEAADALDLLLGTYLVRFDDDARGAADAVDSAAARGDTLGPLAGVPLGVKDFIATREAVATGQSAVHDPDWRRGRDAEVIARLRHAGAVIIGKTTMVEHAAGRPDPALQFPIPRNPWDLGRWTGGSSTGTANGIAAGLFPAGLGTDTSGSVRIPAAMCGITGLKPTRGLVPMDGCLPASDSLDVIGPMAHSARDCAVLLDVMTGTPPREPSDDLAGRRIGVPWTLLSDPSRDIDAACLAAFRRAMAEMEDAGAHIVDFDLSEIDAMIAATMTIMIREMYVVHRDDLTSRWNDYGRSLRRIAAAGAIVTDDGYLSARAYARSIAATMRERMAGLDAVATPTWPTGAPPYQSNGGMPQEQLNLTAAWNATGFPALAVPMGFDDEHMPVSLQLIGPPMTDARLLGIGHAYQCRTDWHTRRPSPDPAATPTPVPDLDDGMDAGETAVIERMGRTLIQAASLFTNHPNTDTTMKGDRS